MFSALNLFANDPKNPDLYNHALKGELQGKRSISVGFDLRIVFIVEGNYEHVILFSVGKHEDAYK
ncbi:hypothetical protein KJ652_00720 [Patescibacteria group bacterium]|nr:hypothetical protein [Patescibacteria group bacterium]MBU1123094.1 hypothetical protein [Patescibacteria group bacterium]MBU1911431.1 hypothetical protein [Patescibacteria group bacterium]